MIFLKRSITAIVLFVCLFCVVYVGICAVGGGIAGAIVGASHPNSQENEKLARQAGGNFVRHNLKTIVWSSLGIALVSSLGLSFSGILPWCRKPAEPWDNEANSASWSSQAGVGEISKLAAEGMRGHTFAPRTPVSTMPVGGGASHAVENAGSNIGDAPANVNVSLTSEQMAQVHAWLASQADSQWRKEDIREVARRQKNIIWMIVVSLVALIIPGAFIITGIVQIYFIYKLATALRRTDAWAYAIVAFIPLIGLVALLHLNSKATEILQMNRIHVGLMGARMSDFDKLPE